MRAPARAALLVCALSLVRCGGDTELPSYRCVKAIDAGNENGGEIASIGSIAYVGGFQTISVYDVSDAVDPKTLAPLSMPARVAAGSSWPPPPTR